MRYLPKEDARCLKTQENKLDNINEKEIKKESVKIDEQVILNAKDKVSEFLDEFFIQSIKEKISYSCEIKENIIEIVINEKKADFLIGYRGEALNSFQTILTTIAAKESNEKIRVELDVLGYREKRRKALEELAEKIAKSVIRTKKAITLEPMTPYERKIIHSKLQENSKVKTTSVGEGLHRKVVISLK